MFLSNQSDMRGAERLFKSLGGNNKSFKLSKTNYLFLIIRFG